MPDEDPPIPPTPPVPPTPPAPPTNPPGGGGGDDPGAVVTIEDVRVGSGGGKQETPPGDPGNGNGTPAPGS